MSVIKFVVGDKVVIKEDTRFAGQCDEVGVVDYVDEEEDYYEVTFENGYGNTYTDEDLEFASVWSWKDRMEENI